MGIKKTQLIQCMVLAIVIPLSFSACGGNQICGYRDESSQTYYYCVNVVNNTDETITVKYDWHEDTIDTNTSKTITWWSNYSDEYIEVDYLDKSKYYYVLTDDTVQVYMQDFQ